MNHHKYLSDSDLALVQATLNKYRSSNARDVLMFDVLLATGARCSEMLNLRPMDLDPVERTVYFTGLKGSKCRCIPVSKDLFSRLAHQASTTHPTSRLFNISYRRLQQLWSIYRPVPKKLHSLRHTFAIRTYKRTLDLQLVQRALGHASLTTTSIYLEYAHSVNEMRKLLAID